LQQTEDIAKRESSLELDNAFPFLTWHIWLWTHENTHKDFRDRAGSNETDRTCLNLTITFNLCKKVIRR